MLCLRETSQFTIRSRRVAHDKSGRSLTSSLTQLHVLTGSHAPLGAMTGLAMMSRVTTLGPEDRERLPSGSIAVCWAALGCTGHCATLTCSQRQADKCSLVHIRRRTDSAEGTVVSAPGGDRKSLKQVELLRSRSIPLMQLHVVTGSHARVQSARHLQWALETLVDLIL